MKLYGYIAKDRYLGSKTYLYLSKPYFSQGLWFPSGGDRSEALPLPDNAFPNLHWGSDPVRVEVIVKPVQKRLKRKLGVLGK